MVNCPEYRIQLKVIIQIPSSLFYIELHCLKIQQQHHGYPWTEVSHASEESKGDPAYASYATHTPHISTSDPMKWSISEELDHLWGTFGLYKARDHLLWKRYSSLNSVSFSFSNSKKQLNRLLPIFFHSYSIQWNQDLFIKASYNLINHFIFIIFFCHKIQT